MNLEEYAVEAARTNAPLDEYYPHMESVHMIFGMITEVGELTDCFKKDLAYQKDIDWVNVGEEVADIMWYLMNFCTINNINLEEELEKNINKLRVRFPDKFTTEHAINRDLESERKELEKYPNYILGQRGPIDQIDRCTPKEMEKNNLDSPDSPYRRQIEE